MESIVQKFENYMKSGSRHLVYPWTITSKIRQFPYTYYYKHKPYTKFYIMSLAAVLPVGLYAMYKFHKIKKSTVHINYFDPHQIPGKELAKHHSH